MIKNGTNVTLPSENATNTPFTTSTLIPIPSPSTVKHEFNSTVPSYCCSENTSKFDFNQNIASTTESTITASVTEPIQIFQRKIWAQDGYGSYIPYDEQYTTPTSILILNFFLVSFLMIVIGIAVYPAVKKYCNSTFFANGSGNTRYWIEDNEEVVSVLTNNIPECSFALLNRNKATEENAEDSSLPSVASMEPLIAFRTEFH